MCFNIRSQRPWGNTTVYKVVRQNWKGPHFPVARQVFKPGRSVTATNVSDGWGKRRPIGPYPFGVGVIYSRKIWLGHKAVAGIYVYRTLSMARKNAQHSGRKVIRCAVSPKDFLFHDEGSWVATYRKVRVIEEVPEKGA